MPKPSQQRRFDQPLQIRITREQLELYRRAANKDGRSLSNWVRDRLDKAAVREAK